MRSPRRVAVGLVVAVLAASLPGGTAGAASFGGPAGIGGAGIGGGAGGFTAVRSGRAGLALRTVTLVTGDRISVVVEGGKPVSVARIVPGKGRAGMTFATALTAGRLRVVPRDAAPLLRAGRLDPRLFDLTALVDFGYDDRRRTTLPLIVTGQPGVTAARAKALPGVSSVRPVPGGTALRAAKAHLPAVWNLMHDGLTVAKVPGQGKLWLDGLRKPALDRSVPQIGAPAAWTAGLTGEGVTVAVVDTGIDATHPDLAGKVVAEQDFVGDGHTQDVSGHGTHVAATIGSVGTPYKGVAPGVRLVSAKVCGALGCPESAMLAGMLWSVEHGAKVVNMSIGGGDSPEQDPIEAAVDDLTARFHALFVIAAGNSGDADGTIESPGSTDSALTVGAVGKTDELAGFSSRGPRVGDAGLKPDITAPGVDIVAARSKDAGIGKPGDTHVSLSGTSMATPHVAGAAAILAQKHPAWPPAVLKAALMASARPNARYGPYAQGAGRVDVARAITQSVVTEPASLSFGRQLWPHQDDKPVRRTVTYRNLGPTAVRLALSLTGGAPAGMFTLSADSVTVPPGGTAGVTLTADTRVASPDALFGGQLVATAAEAVVTTPFAVDKEVESYDVRVRHLDRAGKSAEDFSAFLFEPHTVHFGDVFAADSTVRLPKGRYVAISVVFEADGGRTLLVEPEIAVDRPRTVTQDARTGRPVSVTLAQPDTAPVAASVGALVVAPGGGVALGGISGESFTGLFAGPAGRRRPNPLVTAEVIGLWAKPGVDVADSPFVTQVGFREKGRMVPGFAKRVRRSDLAVVEATHATQGPASAEVFIAPSWADGPFATPGFATPVPLPGRRLEYHNTADGVRWMRGLFETGDEGDGNGLLGPPVTLKPGQRYAEHRNRAVYGPGFTHPPRFPDQWVTRRGDTMVLNPTLFNDQLNWAGDASGESRTTLARNGQVGLDVPFLGVSVTVPPGDAEYRLSVESARGAPNTLSTKVTCAWTFRSGTVAGDRPVPLPLSAVRFRPPLDDHNTAPAGTPFAVPVQVQRQPGSPAGPVDTLRVEVSYDDGATWREARVIRRGDSGAVLLTHPAGPGFVSLRANSADTAGNTVSQTVIRAYRIA